MHHRCRLINGVSSHPPDRVLLALLGEVGAAAWPYVTVVMSSRVQIFVARRPGALSKLRAATFPCERDVMLIF